METMSFKSMILGSSKTEEILENEFLTKLRERQVKTQQTKKNRVLYHIGLLNKYVLDQCVDEVDTERGNPFVIIKIKNYLDRFDIDTKCIMSPDEIKTLFNYVKTDLETLGFVVLVGNDKLIVSW